MRWSCAVNHCSNNYRNCSNGQVMRHSFPKNDILKAKWIGFCENSEPWREWKAGKYSVICSEHFKNDDYYHTKMKKILKADAIPTILIISFEGIEKDKLYVDTFNTDNIAVDGLDFEYKLQHENFESSSEKYPKYLKNTHNKIHELKQYLIYMQDKHDAELAIAKDQIHQLTETNKMLNQEITETKEKSEYFQKQIAILLKQ